MKKIFALFALLVLFAGNAYAANPKIEMDTSEGVIVLELYQDKAPTTVANFLDYVKTDGFKDSLFHRVIRGFMVQGGGFDTDYKKLATKAPIKNEAANGLSNDRGTIAMARTNAPDSATRQFFINHGDNANLNPGSMGAGYAVFGKVIKGMDIVDKIATTETGFNREFGRKNVPTTPVILKQVTIIN